MVVPPNTLPRRPSWSRTPSWSTRYIKKLQQQARNVEFAKLTNETEVTHFLTQEGKKMRWYQASDYIHFERDRQLTALQYRTRRRQGLQFQETNHSIRGLEDLLDGNDVGKKKAIRKHIDCVLEEQQKSPNSPILIRDASVKSSREAKKRAALLGEADAFEGYLSSQQAVQRQVSGVVHSISRKIVMR